MREPGEAPMGAPEPVDQLLDEAGARWRATQPEPRPVDAALFGPDRMPRVGPGFGGRAWSFMAGATAAVALLAAAAVIAPNLIPRIGGGTPATSDPATGYIAPGLASCPLTKPAPPFTPPPAPGADYDLSEGYGWYGTARLWTLLKTDGEIWSWLPETAAGRSMKTFCGARATARNATRPRQSA